MALSRKYTIIKFDEKTHIINVHFHEFDSTREILLPIESEKYITGVDLDNYIMSFSPIKPFKYIGQIKNVEEIKNLVNKKSADRYKNSENRNKALTLRNNLLFSSDWTQLPDAQEQLDDEDKQMWKEYRQALRDLTKQRGWPEVVDWPKRPHILGVTIFE
jgi:hypothetical protein